MSRASRQCLGALGSAAILLATPFGAKAQFKTSYSFGTGATTPLVIFPGAGPSTVEQVAVNHNIGSPYNGYVYVTDEGATVAAPKQRIYIFKPVPSNTGTGATGYVDTGLTITPAAPISTLVPFGLAIGSDDTVWISDSGNNAIETAPPVPTSGTSVAAVVQFSTAGSGPTGNNPFPRALTVIGPVTSAKVYIGEGNVPDVLQLWSGGSASATTAGAAGAYTKVYSTDVNAGNGIVQGPYGIAVDSYGNAYIANKGVSTGSVILKFSPTGVYDSTFAATLPANVPATSNLAAVSYVPDPAYNGVNGPGYLAYSTIIASPASNIGLAFDLNGNYLFGFGPALTPAPANYSALGPITRSTSTPAYLDVDLQGNYYVRDVNGGNSAVTKIFKSPQYVLANASGTPAAIHSSAAELGGFLFFGADDGYLYDITQDDATVLFPPFNTRTNGAGTTAKILGRPSTRIINDTDAHVYFATDDGTVFSINPVGGAKEWATTVAGATNVSTTPAEYNDGTGEFVYVVESVSGAVKVLKLDATTGAIVLTSSVDLGTVTKSSPSIYGNDIIVGTDTGIFRIQTTDLTVLTTIATDATSTSPFIGTDTTLALPTALIVSDAGNVYARQVDTGVPTLLTPVSLGTTVSGSPYEYNNVLYVGGVNGKVYAVNATTGLGAGPGGSLTFFDANADVIPAGSTATSTPGTAQITSGVAVDPRAGSLVFGTVEPGTSSGGKLFQVNLADPTKFNVQWSDAPINTVTAVGGRTSNGLSDGVFVGNDNGKLLKYTGR